MITNRVSDMRVVSVQTYLQKLTLIFKSQIVHIGKVDSIKKSPNASE